MSVKNAAKTRVMFVCLGNICRSPMAEGIFRKKVEARGLRDQFEIESAGTGRWHVDQPPDQRAQACMRTHGIDITGLRGRHFSPEDFETFDWIVCMDQNNFEGVVEHLYDPQHQTKVVKMLKYHPDPELNDVPDPYFGSGDGFERVYTMLDLACERFLDVILKTEG